MEFTLFCVLQKVLYCKNSKIRFLWHHIIWHNFGMLNSNPATLIEKVITNLDSAKAPSPDCIQDVVMKN